MATSANATDLNRRRSRSNGEGGIREDEARGRWIGTVTVGWEEATDATGRTTIKQIRKSVTGKTKKDVVGKLREMQQLADADLPIPSRTLTVAGMLDMWLTDVLPGTVSRVTERQYRDVVRLYIKPRIGHRKLRELMPLHVTRMLRDMEEPTPTRPNGYSANSRRLARSILRRALRWAEVEGMATRNVAALANPVKVEQPEGRTMNPEQARAFLEHIRGDRYEAMYVVALSLGLRVSELLAIGWDDVELEPADGGSPTLTIRRGLKRLQKIGLVIEGVKTRTSRRTVHLPAVTAQRLREHRERQRDEVRDYPGLWPATSLGVNLVFRSANGTALDPSNVWHYLSHTTQQAGLGHWPPHELRHSAASLLLAQNVPLKVVSDLLGHSGINVTANVYSHIMAPARDEAAAAMDRTLTQQPASPRSAT